MNILLLPKLTIISMRLNNIFNIMSIILVIFKNIIIVDSDPIMLARSSLLLLLFNFNNFLVPYKIMKSSKKFTINTSSI